MTDADDLAEQVLAGDLRLHELEDHTDADTATEARRKLLESETDATLDTVGEYAFPAEDAETAIENMVGTIQVPLGVTGPVAVNGGSADGEYYLPLATTEGALLASVNRGCSVIDSAGGADARVTKQGMTRAPVFRVQGIAEAEAVVN
ncbi:MAG: 3-hydroxy-3-methylglutaryl-CoA reductase, partial [Haladaptatus sp.]